MVSLGKGVLISFSAEVLCETYLGLVGFGVLLSPFVGYGECWSDLGIPLNEGGFPLSEILQQSALVA